MVREGEGAEEGAEKRDDLTVSAGQSRGGFRKRLCFHYIQGDEPPANEEQKQWTSPCLPTERPRHLTVLGMGSSVESN